MTYYYDYYEGDERPQSARGLFGLILGLALGAAVLYTLGGPPHLPSELPNWNEVLITLRGSYLPLEFVAYVFMMVGWALWFWIVASLTLRFIVALADATTRGAAWVSSLRAVSNWVTLPVVRRAVDGALIAIVVIHLASRPAPSASAAPLAPPTATMIIIPRDGAEPRPLSQESQQGEEQRAVEYTVQKGDTLWAISERFYGTGYEFMRLVKANVGRQMPDGRWFTSAGVIHPGWVLLIPQPGKAVTVVDGHTFYVVEEGDTLRGIAARLLGDEARWPEIFDANQGSAKLDDKRVLKNPDLIWPGLRLRMPLPTPAPQPAGPPTGVRHSEEPVTPVPAANAVPAANVEPAATPTPVAPVAKTPVATPEPPLPQTPAVSVDPAPVRAKEADPSLLIPSAAAVAVVGAGGALLLARRRVRRSLDEPPILEEPPEGALPRGDFAEAEPGRALTHRLHGGELEPVAMVVEQARRFLDEQGIRDVAVIMARQGRTTSALTLIVGLRDQARLLELAAELGVRLGGAGQASLTKDRDVLWQLSGLRTVGLFPVAAKGAVDHPWLLPLGVLPSRETLYANWRQLDHVLIAGLPGGGAEVVLSSLLGALAARCRPDELQLVTIASRHSLPAQLARLPHQRSAFVDPADGRRVARALEGVRAELLRRMRDVERHAADHPVEERCWPDLVLVIGELADLPDGETTLEMIGTEGPAWGVRLLAATARQEALADEVLALFGTRLVLQMLEEDQSVRLIGWPDAADLGRGDLYLRIDDRVPLRARGFKVSSEHLDQLVRLMHEAYGDPVSAAEPAPVILPDHRPDAQIQQDGVSPVSIADTSIAPDATGSTADPQPEQTALPLAPATAGAAEPEHSGTAVSGGSPAQYDLVLTTVEKVAPDGERSSNGRCADPEAGLAQSVETAAPAQPTNEPQDAELSEEPGLVPPPVAITAAPSEQAEAPREGVGQRSLIQIQCLGAFEVQSEDRELTAESEEGAQYKPWEVLAFLASHPDGTVSKYQAASALWPNADAEQGVNRLRSAVGRLRSLLMAQVPELPGHAVGIGRDGICRLDATLVSSDVQQFLALCKTARRLPPAEAKGALQDARALYRGELLAGPKARGYEWVEVRDDGGVSLREQCREEYCSATRRLARLHYREGRADLAVPLYRSLLKLDPTLEDVVRELYQCYGKLGDLRSLIREDRQLRQALREAYSDPDDPEDSPECCQPEPETVELFKKIRQELETKATS